MTIIDSRKLGTIDRFDIEVHIELDLDASPRDYPDLYSEGDEYVTAFDRGDWGYVGTIVTASKAGIALGTASIWAQEHGSFPGEPGWISPLNGDGNQLAYGYGPQLINEAIEEAKIKLTEIMNG